MAVAIDVANAGTKASSGTGTTTLTTTSAIATGAHAVVLLFYFASAPPVGTVSGGGLTWVSAHSVTTGNIRLELWYAPCPAGLASGTNLTVGRSSGSPADITAVISSYTGIDTTGTVTAFNGGTASTAAWATGTIGGNAGDAYIGGSGGDGGVLRTSTPTAPAVERQDFNSATSGGQITLIDKIGGSASDNLAGTWSSALVHLAIGASFKPAAAAATVIPDITMAPLSH